MVARRASPTKNVLAVELSQLRVRAAVVRDGTATPLIRELIGSASTEEQLDAVKLWSTWFGVPRSMPAVVIVDDLVDYQRDTIVAEDSSRAGWSAVRVATWLNRPIRLVSRSDLLAFAIAPPVPDDPDGGIDMTSRVVVRLGARPQVAAASGGVLVHPAQPIPTAPIGGPDEGVRDGVSWHAVISLAAAHHADAITVVGGTEAEVTRAMVALDCLVLAEQWDYAAPRVHALEIGPLMALEAASGWPGNNAIVRRSRLAAHDRHRAATQPQRIRE